MYKLLIPLLLLAPAGTLVAAEPLRVPMLTVQDSAQAAQLWLDGVVQPMRQSQVASQAQGRVLTRTVKAGDAVAKGQKLLTLEAMKMEFPIASAVDGLVEVVSCQPGQQVKARALLIGLKPAA